MVRKPANACVQDVSGSDRFSGTQLMTFTSHHTSHQTHLQVRLGVDSTNVNRRAVMPCLHHKVHFLPNSYSIQENQD